MGDRRYCELYKDGVTPEGNFCRSDCDCGGVVTHRIDFDPSIIPENYRPVAFRVPKLGEYYYSPATGYRTCSNSGKKTILPYLIFNVRDKP